MIETRDQEGRPNGFVVPIWNALESNYRPDQVYLTAVLPGCIKGPHLHHKRSGMFCCLKGNVAIVIRTQAGEYAEARSGEKYGYEKISVPPGIPAAIYNIGPETALVLNMPTPAWTREDPDEWPVEGWDYDLKGFIPAEGLAEIRRICQETWVPPYVAESREHNPRINAVLEKYKLRAPHGIWSLQHLGDVDWALSGFLPGLA